MKFKVIPYNTEEYANLASFPVSGESGKFYLDLAQMKLYSWNGTAYVSARFRYNDAPAYHGSYLQSGYLEFPRAASSHPIEWHSGDYIRYTRTGRIYRLYDTPMVERLAGTGRHGESFSYRNVHFYDDVKQIENCPFRDLVYGDNGYHFSSRQEVSFAGNVQNMAERIQTNLDNHYGEGVWAITVADDIPASFEVGVIRDITVSGTCLDALNVLYETYPKLGWTFRVDNGVNTIIIGLPNLDLEDSGLATNVFSYENGLTALKKNAKSQDQFCTRLHVYGSERNMDLSYYRNQNIYNAENVFIPNLMLPMRVWGETDNKPDASKAYLENASAIAKYGLISKDVYFDGSEGRPEVFPSIEDATIANLKAAKDAMGKTPQTDPYYPSAETGTIRLDKIKAAVSMPDDDGMAGSGSEKYIEKINVALNLSDSRSLHPYEVRQVLLTSQTFTESGYMEFSLSGSIVITTTTPKPANFLRLAIYGDAVPSRTALLKVVDMTPTDTTTTEDIYSLDSIIRIGTLSEPFSGSICVTIEYGYEGEGSNVRVLSVTSDNATILLGIAPAVTDIFKVRTQQLGFDIKTQRSEGTPILAMKSGYCAGREFAIKNAEYDSTDDSWVLTCSRYRDDSVSMSYPNSTYVIAANDEFVLTGIIMPEEYVLMSAERLLVLGGRLFDEVLNFLPSYEPSVDSKRVYENIKTNPSDEQYKLLEGKYMRLYDADMFPDGDHEAVSMIASITINENESAIPTYRVTLSDDVNVSGGISRTLGELSSQVHSLTNQKGQSGGNYYNSMPDGGSSVRPVFVKNGIPQPVEGVDVPGDILSGGNIEADGGVSAYGIVDLRNDYSGGGGGGGVQSVRVGEGEPIDPDSQGIVNLPAYPSTLAEMSGDTTHRTVTDTEKDTWNSKYSKPSGGIPSTDLSSGVQTSLGKADTALQGEVVTFDNLDATEAESTAKIPTAKGVAILKDRIGIEDLDEYDPNNEDGYFRGDCVKVTTNGIAIGYRFKLRTEYGTAMTGRVEKLDFKALANPLNIVGIDKILV